MKDEDAIRVIEAYGILGYKLLGIEAQVDEKRMKKVLAEVRQCGLTTEQIEEAKAVAQMGVRELDMLPRLMFLGPSLVDIAKLAPSDRARLLSDERFAVKSGGKVTRKKWSQMTRDERKKLVGSAGQLTVAKQEENDEDVAEAATGLKRLVTGDDADGDT